MEWNFKNGRKPKNLWCSKSSCVKAGFLEIELTHKLILTLTIIFTLIPSFGFAMKFILTFVLIFTYFHTYTLILKPHSYIHTKGVLKQLGQIRL